VNMADGQNWMPGPGRSNCLDASVATPTAASSPDSTVPCPLSPSGLLLLLLLLLLLRTSPPRASVRYTYHRSTSARASSSMHTYARYLRARPRAPYAAGCSVHTFTDQALPRIAIAGTC
jgi:hypothetical protein